MHIKEILKVSYDFMIWINNHVFEPLNGDIRIDAFIGIIGVLIAIVIFIAETMNDNKVETQKRFILEKTKMKNIMIFSIIILSFCILKELVPYNSGICNDITKVIFFVLELSLNICIICSICLTIKLFVVSIKLNTNSDYFFYEYDKYIENRVHEIQKKNISYSKKKLRNESIKKFAKDNKNYFSLVPDKFDGYTAIKSNKSGVFKSYSQRSLQTIIDKIEENSIKNSELIVYSEPLFILPLKGGEIINRGVTVAYCKNDFLAFEDSIRNSVLFNDSIPFQDSEINLIINDLFSLASNNMEYNFDSDNRLFNFYNLLYKNNMHSLLNISFEYLRKVYLECFRNFHKNKEFAKFLSLLAGLTYSNEDFDRYKFISNYIYYCYKEQLNLSDNIRDVSYDFTNTFIRYDYYSIRRNNDSIYYDVLLSNLMNFLFDLIEKREFKAINDLFHNVIFDYNGHIDEEPDSYDVIKMQFSFGFIYGLIILFYKDIFNEKDKEDLKIIINHIKSSFVDIYSQNEAIEYYKKYYNHNSNVYNVYYNFDFRFANKEYRNSWSGINIDDIFILKEYIYVFGINYSNSEEISPELISKDNKYFYERLLETVKSEEKSKIESVLDIHFNKDSLIKILNVLISECKIAEEEFVKNNKINKEKTDSFRNLILDEIEKGNELISYLKDNDKYSILNKNGKRLFGFKQIIGRSIFFDDVYGLDNVSRDYARSILSGISKDYLKKLDSISEVMKQGIDEYIISLEDDDEYVIITSPINRQILNLNCYNDRFIEIDGRNIDIILMPKAKDIYLIKKKQLPRIELLKPNIDNTGTFQNGVYYDLKDCSTNNSAREEILKNTKWLEEKGTLENQIEFLKGNCAFTLFVSPLIRKIPNSKCYKFVIKETEG